MKLYAILLALGAIFGASGVYGYIINMEVLRHPNKQTVVLYGDMHVSSFQTIEQIRAVLAQLDVLKRKKDKHVCVCLEGHTIPRDPQLAEQYLHLKKQFLFLLEELRTKKELNIGNIDLRIPTMHAFEKLLFHEDAEIARNFQRLQAKYSTLNHKNIPAQKREQLKKQLQYAKRAYLKSREPMLIALKIQVYKALALLKKNAHSINGQKNISAYSKRLFAKTLFDCEKRCKEWLTMFHNAYIEDHHITRKIYATISILDLNFISKCLMNPSKKHVLFAGAGHTENISKFLKRIGFVTIYKKGSAFNKFYKKVNTHEVWQIFENDRKKAIQIHQKLNIPIINNHDFSYITC